MDEATARLCIGGPADGQYHASPGPDLLIEAFPPAEPSLLEPGSEAVPEAPATVRYVERRFRCDDQPCGRVWVPEDMPIPEIFRRLVEHYRPAS
jgi:hypothetical protein